MSLLYFVRINCAQEFSLEMQEEHPFPRDLMFTSTA